MCIDAHRIYPTGGVPENAGDAVHTTVRVQTRSEISKKEAVPVGTGGAGQQPGIEYNVGRLVDLRLFDASTGLFTHPHDAEKKMTLKELIVRGFLNPYTVTVHDRGANRHLKLLDAIDDHIVDDVAGTIRDTQTGRVHDFASALRDGLVREDTVESFIQDRYQQQPSSGGGIAGAYRQPSSGGGVGGGYREAPVSSSSTIREYTSRYNFSLHPSTEEMVNRLKESYHYLFLLD